MKFTHFDDAGNAVMVDVSSKKVTHREAIASGVISMSRECFEMIKNGESKKGDVLAVARIAGIMATKQTSSLIPLCHPLSLQKVDIVFAEDARTSEIKVTVTVVSEGKSGVEIEAMLGVQVTLLTIYDMCKAVDRSMEIGYVHLEKKIGGKSGLFQREDIINHES